MDEQIQQQVESDVITPKEVENGEITSGCKACGSYMVEEGYTLELCSECRDKLSKRPVPIQIKIAAAVFVLVIIFSLIKFPAALRAGIQYDRGIKAAEASKYATALKSLKNAEKAYPDSDKVMVKLLTAYYMNLKIKDAYSIFDKLAGPNPESKEMDKDLIVEVNSVMDKMDMYYYPSKELFEKLKELKDPTNEELVNIIKPFVEKNPKEVYGAYYMADVYFEMKRYEEANTVLTKLLAAYPDFYSGQLLEASVLRELGQYDKAVEGAKKVLQDNSENIAAIVTLSKIELKRKNNEKGLEYANKAYALDSEDPYVMANLSLAYHYNNMIKERDEKFKTVQTLIGDDKYTMELLTSIFDGSLQWQK